MGVSRDVGSLVYQVMGSLRRCPLSIRTLGVLDLYWTDPGDGDYDWDGGGRCSGGVWVRTVGPHILGRVGSVTVVVSLGVFGGSQGTWSRESGNSSESGNSYRGQV